VSEDKMLLIEAMSTFYPSISSPDKDNPSVYRFADVPQPPDPFLTDDYVAKYRGKGTTIVIDNGVLFKNHIIRCLYCP
jgi:hypothetical protein